MSNQTIITPEPTQVQPPFQRGLDSLIIDKATVEHIPYLRSLKENVMHDRYRPAPDEEGFAQWKEVYCTEDYFREAIASDSNMLLCIGNIREPVGMVVLRNYGDGTMEIDDLLVLTPRHGDGTRLLLAALRYAEIWGMQKVCIDLYPGHDGVVDFLALHGFTRVVNSSNDLGRTMHRYERAIQQND